MRAGQVLVTVGATGGAVRTADVLEVLGVNAGPPFLVRWRDTGRVQLLYPDSDVWTEAHPPGYVPGLHGNRCG